jgi:glycosyltransferase involved in cell wall biosynthesis
MGKKLAVLILTRNEADNIAACLATVRFADEVVVIDAGSTDATQAIAQQHGARVVQHDMDASGFAGQRNFARQQTEADWVCYLDADERVNEALAQAIQAAVQADRPAAYAIRRVSVVMGRDMYHGVYRPDYVTRLFPRSAAVWSGVVHEQVDTGLSISRLPGFARHYADTSWEQYLDKLNQYTSLMAQKMQQRGRHTGFIRMQLHAVYAFFQMYIVKQGFRDGRQGFLLCLYHYFYTLTKYVKLYYLDRENGNIGENKTCGKS